jgi:iron(III) transport system permease protein
VAQMTWGLVLLAVMSLIISKLDLIKISPLISDQTVKQNHFWILAIAPTVAIIGFGFYTSISWIINGASFFTEDFAKELINSLYLVVIVSLICLITTIAYIQGWSRNALERVGLSAYALPGTVIGAVWLYIGGSWIPMFILLSIAITTRYFGLMINSVAVACKGSQRYFEVVDTYVITYRSRFIEKVKLVLPSMIIGVCLIILDVLRELPISMLLQPMNFQTLAMRMNYIARNEVIPSLGPHSLVIVSLGLLLCGVIIKVTYDKNNKS